MSRLRNSVSLIGRLGKDPETRTLDNGTVVTTFSLATSETYKNAQGEKVEETQWHNIVAWRKLAEIIDKWCEKGQEIAIEGKLVTRSYENSEGEKKYITEVVARDMLMLGGKKESNTQQTNASAASHPPQPGQNTYQQSVAANKQQMNPAVQTNAGDMEEDDDDLPF